MTTNNVSISRPIVNKDGLMTLEMALWSERVSNPVIIGTGSPEGVVEALQGSLYMDSSGSSGSILYIKRDVSVGGDSKKGWIVV